MKKVVGALLVLIGIVLGLYLGLWVLFIGGVIDLIKQIRLPEMNTGIIAWGIVKVLFAGFIGTLSAMIFILPGLGMIKGIRLK